MKINWIEPGVLAGSGIPLSQEDLASLREQGIGAILTLTEHPLTVQTKITAEMLAENGLIGFHAPIVDQHPPEKAILEQAVQFINQMRSENRPVLVHCAAGIGRTGTVLHGYYLAQGMSLDEAKNKVKTGKPTSQFFILSDVQQAFLENYTK